LTPDRVLVWDGCVNVRDLGGLPLEGGGQTRFGVVVRADSIRGLTERGWRALLEYGVRSAIDLRADDEVAADPPGEAPIPVAHLPLAPSNLDWSSVRAGYVGLLESYRPQFARAATAIAQSEDTVVVHCQGGRDRTGVLVALLLALAGVELEAIVADHVRSEQSWAPYLDAWYAEAETEDELARRRRVTAPAGRSMAEVLDHVEASYGGPMPYLTGGGTSGQDLDRLMLRLRG
jgi:rhodanese-related sulfurtransferase